MTLQDFRPQLAKSKLLSQGCAPRSPALFEVQVTAACRFVGFAVFQGTIDVGIIFGMQPCRAALTVRCPKTDSYIVGTDIAVACPLSTSTVPHCNWGFKA
jgi:hypothetical protein